MISQESQEKESMKAAKEKSALETKKLNKKNKRNAVRQYIKKAIMAAFSIKAGILLLGSLMIFAIVGVVVDLFDGDASAAGGGSYSNESFTGSGNPSPFGCPLTKDEFVTAVNNYNGGSDYNTYMKPYAESFYDICTSSEYNVNPCLAFAHACLETGFGSTSGCKNDKNYFGLGHGNDETRGDIYSTVEECIEVYCEWVKNNATEGTSGYNASLARGQEYAQENSKLQGTPANNIYVLYCRYAYLGDIHYCNEPDFNNPKGTEYYKNNGSNWGKGGRIYIHYMYEIGGLFTGRYKELCGHPNASDPTTTRERADYQEYTTNKRISIAKNVFGENAFITNSASFSGKVVQYYQGGPEEWASVAYGGGTLASSGCGPTCMAMVASTYTGQRITPPDILFNGASTCYVSEVGASWSLFSEVINHYNFPFQVQNLGMDTNKVIENLKKGYLVISSQGDSSVSLFSRGGRTLYFTGIYKRR